jgi:acetyl esterase/lipase
MFSVGTLDVLLDDSVMMATKWAMSPAEAILKLYPGAPHNFTCFSPSGTERTEECLLDIATFMNERMA